MSKRYDNAERRKYTLSKAIRGAARDGEGNLARQGPAPQGTGRGNNKGALS